MLKLENLTFENKDKSIVINLLISKRILKFLQTWFNDFTWISNQIWRDMVVLNLLLVEPALHHPILKKKMK